MTDVASTNTFRPSMSNTLSIMPAPFSNYMEYGETRASAADNAHAQSSRDRILLRHDLFHLGNRVCGQADRSLFCLSGLNFQGLLWWP